MQGSHEIVNGTARNSWSGTANTYDAILSQSAYPPGNCYRGRIQATGADGGSDFMQTAERCVPCTIVIGAEGAGSGTVTINNNDEVPCGTTITATATPLAGSYFAGWSGHISSSSNPLTFTLGTSMVLDARFELIDSGGGGDCPNCDSHPQPWTGGESPIIIDVLGNGYDLTSVEDGVNFDISPGGKIERTAWTHGYSDDAFLVLDRNGDGLITNGVELFGNHTQQPRSTEPNGFTALRVFDSAEAGGNGDSLITSADAVFSALRLWTDTNHNGVSEANELTTVADAGVETIGLTYRTARRQDGHGNVFRYRAPVTFVGRPHSPRWAYDVFFVVD